MSNKFTINPDTFKILVLDGGGSKGVYTLGVLKELEKRLGGTLSDHFKLIYGTSTGSIIASLVALGWDIPSIEKKYLELIPVIMSGWTRKAKSKRLKEQADTIFNGKKFDSFKTDIGIVATNYDKQKPLIFKTKPEQAHGMHQNFVPGFGCTISDAVQCSCAAYPVFAKKVITTTNFGTLTVVDGGFIANNATLFALIDAHKAFGINDQDLRVLSIGTGVYLQKSLGIKMWAAQKIKFAQFAMRIIECSSNSNEQLSALLYPQLKIVRVQETFTEERYRTNMVESDVEKLKLLITSGMESYQRKERDILNLLSN